ncbi:hypothetical protein GMO_15470 [Gluconobacter morbifer G707]|uniref:Uncharacterized protein n=1 Tax=Gluconobacter morbifer G707 TaxID=1088869 RepID=G6XJ81_9PROT|nr:hypothetical protein GMO_15470 [Gluconobacter morbifer G707]
MPSGRIRRDRVFCRAPERRSRRCVQVSILLAQGRGIADT